MPCPTANENRVKNLLKNIKMGRFLRCPLPPIPNKPQHSDQIDPNIISESPPNSSLNSQQSLPSVRSLTPNVDNSTTAIGAAASAYHHCLATLKGHSSYIFSLALAGKHLYCGASDGEISVWDRNPSAYNSQSDNRTVVDGQISVKSIVVSGDTLFTAHSDYKIRVWKIDNLTESSQKYKMVTVLPTIGDRFTRLFSPKNYVKIRRNRKRTWVHHVDAVSALALSKDASLLYSVSWDRTFKLWRTSDFKCLESVQNAHDDAINAVVLSNDGLVYTGSADKRIKIWRRNDVVPKKQNQKHSLISTLEKHRSAVNALALSHDGSILYSGACDRSIIVWEKDGDGGAAHMAVAGALRGHTKAILCLAVVSDLLCSGSADKTVRVWKRGNGSGNSYFCLAVFEGHRNPVKCLTACLDNSQDKSSDDLDNSYLIYSGSLDFEIKVWKIGVPFK